MNKEARFLCFERVEQPVYFRATENRGQALLMLFKVLTPFEALVLVLWFLRAESFVPF